jgi:predicted TIM-barrel fold metal-dependent hydrolase
MATAIFSRTEKLSPGIFPTAAGRLRSSVFPTQSHIQFSLTRTLLAHSAGADGALKTPDLKDGLFLDQIGFDYAVLSPPPANALDASSTGTMPWEPLGLTTTGLLKLICNGIRFKGIGVLPMHDAEAALEELRHAYKSWCMRSPFPATGVHLNLGAKPYWPVYAEAARLGCPVVVHGGGHWDLGMETMNVSTGANAIGHPMSLAIALAEMVFNNLFERFPGLRVAYLEGGPLWFLMALERFSRSYEAGTPMNPRGELLHLPEGQSVGDYLRALIQAGRLVIGIEGGETDLAYAIKVAGDQAFMFSSDFPHEVNAQTIRKEIRELREREEISEEAKEAILHGNAARFYKLAPASN